jgi:hypothetical protein
MSESNTHNLIRKDFVTISRKDKLKQAAARQIIEETRVCGFAATYFEDLNESVFVRADQPFRIGLIINDLLTKLMM